LSKQIDFQVVINSLYPSLHEVERKIADVILKNPTAVINMTAAQLAQTAGAADSSVIRFCQRVGFDGFSDFKINLARNLKNPEELLMEDIKHNDDYDTIARKVFAASIQALEDSLAMLDRAEFRRAVEVMLKARKIEFYGIGTSASLVMDAYYRLMRIGFDAYAATDPHIMRFSASNLNNLSVAVGISHTGRTRDTVRALQIAKEKRATIICITGYQNTPVAEIADVRLITSAKETTIMKEAVSSRIAQITVLDSLYTCLALQKYDTVFEKLESMSEILNEVRY
jgi:RpiR family carbohydrate utilization transcriptional regulator